MNTFYNLHKSYNSGTVSIKVIYFSIKRIIKEVLFLYNSPFYSVLNYFDKNLKEEGKTKLKKLYIYNDRVIDFNEPLINLVELKKNSSPSTIKSIELKVEIEEKFDNNLIFEEIIQPKIKPFGLFIFKPKEGTMNEENYLETIIEKYELNKFQECSSFCNSPKYFFMSGGKIDNNSHNNFWIINNKSHNIIMKKMPIEKSNHSMIYININERELIFIVGGDNNLTSFCFNIAKNNFINSYKTNTMFIKPILFKIQNYLYCCNNIFKGNENNFFERTNLIKKEKKWEKIMVNFNEKIQNISIESFGVTNSLNDNILFIGGNMNNILKFDHENNTLDIIPNSKNFNINILNNKFYDIDEFHCISFPSSFETNKTLFMFNKVKYCIRMVNLKGDNKGNRKIKLKSARKNDFGKIIINTQINERLKFQFEPEIVSAQNLTISQNIYPPLIEQEIIKKEENLNINENKIFEKNHIYKKSKTLMISNSTIFNNLIELFVQKRKK